MQVVFFLSGRFRRSSALHELAVDAEIPNQDIRCPECDTGGGQELLLSNEDSGSPERLRAGRIDSGRFRCCAASHRQFGLQHFSTQEIIELTRVRASTASPGGIYEDVLTSRSSTCRPTLRPSTCTGTCQRPGRNRPQRSRLRPSQTLFDVTVDKNQHPLAQPEAGKALVYVIATHLLPQ